MEAATFKLGCNPVQLPLFRRNPNFPCSPPFTSLSFRTSPPPYPQFSIKASSSSNRASSNDQFHSSLVKTTLIAAVTASAVFLTRFTLKPVIAAPFSARSVATPDSDDLDALRSNPVGIDALKILVEMRVKNQQVKEAIPVMEQLISLLPDDDGLELAKAYMHLEVKELELAKIGFEYVLSKDPFNFKACHGLLIAASEDESSTELKRIEGIIKEGMEKCKKARKKDVLREFKLVLAQVFVLQEAFDDALKVYDEVLKEEPRDFRPWMCQGAIYSALNRKQEAEKCFSKYRRLVPKGHRYAELVDEKVLEEVFSKKSDLKSSAVVDEQVIEGDKDSLKAEEQVIIEDGIVDSKKIEEEDVAVEDGRGDSKNEEENVENEKASPSVSDEQPVRSE